MVVGASSVTMPTTGGGPVAQLAVGVLDANGVSQSVLRRDEPVTLQVQLHLLERIPDLDVALYVINRSGVRVVNENASTSGVTIGRSPGDKDVRLTVPGLLPAGDYVVGVWLGTDHQTFAHGEALTLSILPLPTDRDTVHGAVRPAVRWSTGEAS